MTDDLCCAGIYCIRHIESGKVYVGQSKSIAKRIRYHKYPRSCCPYIRHAIQHYGWDAFQVTILERVDDLTLLNEREQYWLDLLQACNPRYGYNICPIANSLRGLKHTDSTKAKISTANKGKRRTAEQKVRYSAARKGVMFSEEHKAHMSAARKGKPLSEEHKTLLRIVKNTPEYKAKSSASHMGKHLSDAAKAKVSIAVRNRLPISDETRAKMCAVQQNKPKPSIETREKLSLTKRKQNHSDERTALLLAYILLHPDASASYIAHETGIPRTTISRLLNQVGWYKTSTSSWARPPQT